MVTHIASTHAHREREKYQESLKHIFDVSLCEKVILVRIKQFNAEPEQNRFFPPSSAAASCVCAQVSRKLNQTGYVSYFIALRSGKNVKPKESPQTENSSNHHLAHI